MEEEPRRLRADAERNRCRLLQAATTIFCERGLDVGVGEIAQAAEVGRGTLFRHFPTKEHLIKAILVERLHESVQRARAALESDDPGTVMFELIDDAVARSQEDRALWEALDDAWLRDEEVHAAHTELFQMVDALLARAQEAGAVRPDVGAIDLMMMIKGVCEASRALSLASPEVLRRQLDLVRAALSPAAGQQPLHGARPTVADLEQVVRAKQSVKPRQAHRATG